MLNPAKLLLIALIWYHKSTIALEIILSDMTVAVMESWKIFAALLVTMNTTYNC